MSSVICYRVGSGRVGVEAVWLKVWLSGLVLVAIHSAYMFAAVVASRAPSGSRCDAGSVANLAAVGPVSSTSAKRPRPWLRPTPFFLFAIVVYSSTACLP